MSESEETPPARSGPDPSEGHSPPTVWRERAAFHVTIHSATVEGEALVWETRADQEERGISMVWSGLPGQELLEWMIQMVGLSETSEAGRPPAEVSEATLTGASAPGDAAGAVAPETPVDDLTRINGITATTAQRLRKAGIGTFARLAASTPEELGELLKRPAESIAKRGWIEQARMLAESGAAHVSPTGLTESPEETAANVVIEVHLDATGDILDQRIIREGEPLGSEPLPGEGRLVRFFAQAPAPQHELARGGLYELFLDELALERLPDPSPAGVTRLCARSTLHVTAPGGGPGAPASYIVFVVASNLETGATTLLQSARGHLDPTVEAVPLELTFELPPVGRYHTLLVAMLADMTAPTAVAGPRLRVLP
ncbi:MAG: hypothetical protein RMK84_13415 [Oscillochloridaceae bacterium]|nr:hypothetical protein [Chloroflexaceae bacterium]MDW8391119.1 hypothetical protein [Oscillochloridaceae bacterium]